MSAMSGPADKVPMVAPLAGPYVSDTADGSLSSKEMVALVCVALKSGRRVNTGGAVSGTARVVKVMVFVDVLFAPSVALTVMVCAV